METTSRATQCDYILCEKMKNYSIKFSENNVFLKNGEIVDKNRAILLKHVTMIEEFEKEKVEMKEKFAREKESLKRAYENEIKEYQAEIEKLTKIMDSKMGDIENKYKEQFNNREALQREIFEKERKCLKQSIHEQMDLMAEVESEIKRILKTLLGELKRFEPAVCKKLEEDLCEKNIKQSCVSWLRDVFAENKEITSDSTEAGIEEKRPIAKESMKEDELYEVGESFRRQKKELTAIFMKEKRHLEEEIENNCIEYKKKLDREYEERMKNEVNVWQETIKEYEREIGILRYEREQMDRNYCLEIDRLKLETEKEKIEICSKYMKERELLKKKLSDTVISKIITENGLTHVANKSNE